MDAPDLVLGPLLRHVGRRMATIWVETDRPCEVGVLGATARTFSVGGHHYAVVVVKGLRPGTDTPYEVTLDGRAVWPLQGGFMPPSRIRTLGGDGPLRLVFGSCRVSAPLAEPWSLTKDEDDEGREIDALVALAEQLRTGEPGDRPDLLILLGDQVYADQVSPATRALIDARDGDRNGAPADEVADFEEYTALYREAWRPPLIRWLLSTVPSAMIFDDHDVHDDWNTSDVWTRDIRTRPWWHERILGAYASYWIYQHLGNMSPQDLAADELLQAVQATDDATDLLRDFARRAEEGPSGTRWSYCRDLGDTRLVVVDTRAGRVLDPAHRDMLDPEEWSWFEEQLTGDVDHLIIGASLPFLLGEGLHHLEAWNEAVAGGAWGRPFARVAERVRQALDLEHWAAFDRAFHRLSDALEDVAAGRRGAAPASIVLLGGDVHHAYLAEARFPGSPGHAPVYQGVCSPFRNPLSRRERRMVRSTQTRPFAAVTRRLARAAGVRAPTVDWDICDGPWFDNQVAGLQIEGRSARMTLHRSPPGDPSAPRLEEVLDRPLTAPDLGERASL
jgi:hypothetical protein